MLELRHPPPETQANTTMVRRLFDEALLLDPRHGPVYNAYGNMELQYGNTDDARAIYERGVQRNCTDVASVYHGYAKFELSQGNVEDARSILRRGLEQVERQEGTMLENAQRDRSIFLAHTLGMLELNSQNLAEAKQIFASGLKRHGGTSQLLLGAALCEVRLGNENGARVLFEQAVHADEKHAHAWQSWGVMEMRAGNFVTAKMLFECGIKSNPRHGALWQAYGKVLSFDNYILFMILSKISHDFCVEMNACITRSMKLPWKVGWVILKLLEREYESKRLYMCCILH